MKNRSADTQIPPKWLVRVVSCVPLVAGAVILYAAITNFAVFGWWFGTGIFLAGASVTGASLASLYTGDPEWILLNLILTY